MTSGPFGVDYSDISKGTLSNVAGAAMDFRSGIKQSKIALKPHKQTLKALERQEFGTGPKGYMNKLKTAGDPQKSAAYKQKAFSAMGPKTTTDLQRIQNATSSSISSRFKKA